MKITNKEIEMEKHELQEILKEFCEEMSHSICMGIRKGLYGANSNNDSNGITEGLYAIADSMKGTSELIIKNIKE